MKFKCPDCRSTNVSRKSATCICNKCGEEWQLSVEETERLLKEDKKLAASLEGRQLQTYIEHKNATGKQTGRGVKCTTPDTNLASLHRKVQDVVQLMTANVMPATPIPKTSSDALPCRNEDKAANIETSEPDRRMETLRQTVSMSNRDKLLDLARRMEALRQTVSDKTNEKSAAPVTVETDEPRLLTCRVCKKDVSSDAASCPHCGDPYITEEKKQAAEKAKKESEADQKRQRIYQLMDELLSSDTSGSCPACYKGKDMVPYSRGDGFYYRRSCNCKQDDICKAIYGVTMNEL